MLEEGEREREKKDRRRIQQVALSVLSTGNNLWKLKRDPSQLPANKNKTKQKKRC
jgi:hypothetical protein